MLRSMNWQTWLLRLVLLLWALQVVWLAWYFAPEAQRLAGRIYEPRVGAAVRQEDPFFRWLGALDRLMPGGSSYVFLERCAPGETGLNDCHVDLDSPAFPLNKKILAGTEILVRYHLAPRCQLFLPPKVSAPFLFFMLRQGEASYLIIRGDGKTLGAGAEAAVNSAALRPVALPGPGLVFAVDYARLQGGFYD